MVNGGVSWGPRAGVCRVGCRGCRLLREFWLLPVDLIVLGGVCARPAKRVVRRDDTSMMRWKGANTALLHDHGGSHACLTTGATCCVRLLIFADPWRPRPSRLLRRWLLCAPAQPVGSVGVGRRCRRGVLHRCAALLAVGSAWYSPGHGRSTVAEWAHDLPAPGRGWIWSRSSSVSSPV